jgi:RNA polymerase sigma-70 factor (ECF subfamily)
MERIGGLSRSEGGQGHGPMADKKDFAPIAMPHLDAVYRAARALCGREDEAEDLVQIVYAKALERFESFAPGGNCRAWLLQILRNTWIDELRHRQVVGPVVSIEAGRPAIADPPHPEETAWSNAGDVLENFSDSEVRRALGELPDDQRLTLFLVDVEGLSQEEVAGITGVPQGTVKSRTSRARAVLREKLMAHARQLGWLGRGR